MILKEAVVYKCNTCGNLEISESGSLPTYWLKIVNAVTGVEFHFCCFYCRAAFSGASYDKK
jgi:hypothetical protein